MAKSLFDTIARDIQKPQSDFDRAVSGPMPMDLSPSSVTKSGVQIIRPVEYTTPLSAVYDRNSDGDYVARFENYLGATGNEDRLGREQSGGEQLLHGITKNAAKTFNYALDSLVGTAYGLYKGVSSGDLTRVFDNDLSKKLDDWNKDLDYKLPNYYTDEQKSKNILQSMLTTNFWANDVAGGLAFVGGAILPEIAIAALTGGTTLGGTAAKIGIKAGAKALTKDTAEFAAKNTLGAIAKVPGSVAKKLDDLTGYSKGRSAIRKYNSALYGKTAGDIVSTAGFLLRSSNFEAGMEARQNFKESTDSFFSTFEEKNGRPPTYEESRDFINDARSVSNGVYGANLGILALSNAAMFGKTFDVDILPNTRKGINNYANRLIGMSTKKLDDGVLVMQKANKAQKIAGTTYKILSKPLIEGVYEEGLQGVVGKSMQNYLEHQYDPKHNDAESHWAFMTDAFAEQYGSKEGWKEMGIGMIIGFAGGSFSKQGFAGVGKNSYKTAVTEKQAEIERANQGLEALRQNKDLTSDKGVALLRSISKANAASATRKNSKNKDYAPSVDNMHTNLSYIQSQEGIKTHKEIVEDFNLVVDQMQLSPEQQIVLEDSGVEIGDYKENMKMEFERTLTNYKYANKVVNALELNKSLDNTPGNIQNVGQAMVWNIMMGKDAAHHARKIGEEIETAIGTRGITDYMHFYNSLSEDKKLKIQEFKTYKAKANRLRNQAIDIQNQLAGITAKRKTGVKDSTLERKFQQATEKYVATTQAIQETEAQVVQMEKAFDKDFETRKFELDSKTDAEQFTSVTQALEEVEKLDDFIDSLETMGKNVEATTLKTLVEEFKMYSDAHREFVNGYRRMTGTNFFKSEEGRSFLGRLLGPKYKMTADFQKAIEENDALIDQSLNLVGIRGYDRVQEIIQDSIENNAYLSDREKFRLESIIRLQLNMKALNDSIDEISMVEGVVDASVAPKGPVLEGDSIALRVGLNIQADKLSSADILDNTIQKITDQIDFIRKSVRDNEKISELENELETLKQQKDAIEKNGEQQPKGSEQGGSRQYQRTEEGQQEEGEGKGSQREATKPKADNSDSNIASKAEIEARIAQVEEELSAAKNSIRMVDSPEYIRLEELTQKDNTTGLTEAETEEYEELKKDINQWLLVTGTVTEGVRLSDLVRQKVTLAETQTETVEKVEEITEQDVILNTRMTETAMNPNYDLGQTYQAVTIKYDAEKNEVALSGIRQEDVASIFTVTNQDGSRSPIDFEYSFDPENRNMLIPMGENGENLAKVNTANSNISVLPTNENLLSTYSLVITHKENMAGESESSYLQSTYTDDFTETQDAEAIYELQTPTENDLGTALTLRVDTRDEYNRTLISAYLAAKSKKDKALLKEVLQKNLRITVFDNNNRFVATLKAKKFGSRKTTADVKFEQFRDSIVEDTQYLERILGVADLYTLDIPVVTTKKIFLGHPNFNFSKNSDGTVTVNYRRFDDNMSSKIVDIGYATEGSISTRAGEKGIDTTFLKKAMKDKQAKIPFVVFQKGTRRVAYPVKLTPRPKQDNSEFIQVFNSKMDDTSKVVRLNQLLAERGVDIKTPGNFFYAVGNTSNLTGEFFSKKLSQTEGIDYFYPLTEWVKDGVPMQDILKQQALININLSNPLHSPKVAMDLTQVLKDFEGQTSVTMEDIVEQDTKAVVATTSSPQPAVKKPASKLRWENLPSEKDLNQKAQDEKNSDC